MLAVFLIQCFDCARHVQLDNLARLSKCMKRPLGILLTLLFLAVLAPCYATDVVTIDAKYKKDTVSSPDPEYPIKAQHLGYQGQGIYRLIINDKTGVVDQVQVMQSTHSRELDASAVMTLFNWKFRPGVNRRDLLIVFQLTGWSRGLH